MLELYEPFTRTGAPIMMMDCASAELAKYAANAMLATRISFMNEVANVCELVGADVDHVGGRSDRQTHRHLVSVSRRRIRRGCFPKDVQAMRRFAADKDYDFKILDAVEEVNRFQKTKLARQCGSTSAA